MLYGIDVSNWQGSVNWAKHARDGVKFAFAKATEGTDFTDGTFARNWSAMREHGIVRGAYHFAHPKNDPQAEARYFLSHVREHGLHDDDLLCLDLEVADGRSASAVASYARQWCAYVTKHAGAPIVYTFISFARGGYGAGLGGYPLWIAAPSSSAGHPPMPLGPWRDWTFHQYSDNPIDKNVFNGSSKSQVRALGVGGHEEDEVPLRTSLGKKQDQPLKWNDFTVLTWDAEYADPSHAHWDGDHPGYVAQGGSWADFNLSVRIDGLTSGDQWQVEYRVYDDKDGKTHGDPWTEIVADFPASTGRQYVTGAVSKGLSDGQHVYVAVAIFPKGGDAAGRAAPTAVSGRWTISQDRS